MLYLWDQMKKKKVIFIATNLSHIKYPLFQKLMTCNLDQFLVQVLYPVQKETEQHR